MRIPNKAALLVPAMLAAAPAAAQVTSPGPAFHNTIPAPPRMRTGGPLIAPAPRGMPNRPHFRGPMPPRMSHNSPHFSGPRRGGGGRWGGSINGRWHGGVNAPGGWSSYRRPSRGWTLPPYWMGSSFHIPDYGSFGLGAPPYGYFWVRYYDDAVMVDSYGRVRDSVSGIGWDADADAYAGGGYGYGYAGAAASASASAGAITPVDPDEYYDDDYYEDQGGYGAQYGMSGGYAPPVAGGPPVVHYPSCPQTCPGQAHGGGYGYYYGGPVTTTIVIQQAPAIVTTTTTIEEEVIEETVVYGRNYAPTKRVIRKGPTKAKRRCRC